MNYSKIMQEIKSTRDYKTNPVDHDLLGKIAESGKNEEIKGISIIIFEDGEKTTQKLQGKAGYFGKLITAPHYIAVTGPKSSLRMEQAAYITEQMRFKAHELGLGSCWITIPDTGDIKADLSIPADTSILAFIGLGYRYSGIFKKDIQEQSFRQAATEMVFLENWKNTPKWDDLEERGLANIFYLTRFAPSWGNKQPWKFLVAGSNIVLMVDRNADTDIDLDTGLIRFYFEKACIDQGIKAVKLEDHTNEIEGLEIPDEYQVRTVYKL